jgi:coproporphyrinogen III oxidase-like Fe-S oxidoreductase
MMLGLRLTREGVSDSGFKNRFGLTIEEAFPREVKSLLARQLVEWVEFEDGPHLRLTRRGILFGNQAFMEFVD